MIAFLVKESKRKVYSQQISNLSVHVDDVPGRLMMLLVSGFIHLVFFDHLLSFLNERTNRHFEIISFASYSCPQNGGILDILQLSSLGHIAAQNMTLGNSWGFIASWLVILPLAVPHRDRESGTKSILLQFILSCQ